MMTSLPQKKRELRAGVRKQKMMRRCKMLWLALLVLTVEAQEIRIPAYVGRTQNKPVIRVIPSDGIVIRTRRPDQPIPAPILIRQSSVMRIQPVLLPPRITPRVSLLGTLTQMGLRQIAALIEVTELQPFLAESGPITLFAPTDEAFSLMSIPNNQNVLREFVLQHVVSGRIMPEDVKNDAALPSLRTGNIPLRLNVYDDGQMLSVSGSQFLDDARDADNVRIQPIDRVLYPISNEDLGTEVKLTFPKMNEFLMKTSLNSKLSSGTFTLFAPTDGAFDALTPEVHEKLLSNSTLLTKVLLNHVVPGTHYSAVLAHGYSLRSLGGEPIHFTNRRGLILANGVPVVKSDISVTNGVIHALNRLLLPPELHPRRRPATVAPPPFKMDALPVDPVIEEYLPVPVFIEPPPPIPRSITKTISTPLQLPNGQRMTFSTANSLLRRSLLLSTLRNNGSEIGYTILVPSDSAYKDLGQNVLDRLRRNSRLLRRMLLSQMLEGKLNLTTVGDQDTPVRTLGGTIVISSLNGGNSLMVGGARVLSIRQAADGMVLVTDRVTLPSSSRNVADALQPFTQFKRIIKSRPKIQNTINSDGSVYTIFAPTDAALSTLPSYQLQDSNFISELFWSHVVSGAYYRNRLYPGLRLTTVRGNTIIIHRTPSGGVFVNEKPVTGEEIITGNGVVHPIDSLLFIPTMPPQMTPAVDANFDEQLNKIARDHNATMFVDWMKKAHLQNQLRAPSMRANGCTLFLPTNTALSNMSPTLRVITLGDPERLNKFIRFHISPQVLSLSTIHDNALIPSLLPGKRIRCNVYASGRMPGIMTVSGCRVRDIKPIIHDTNVTVAVLDEAMTPPVGDLALTIAKTPMLTNFSKILTVAGGKDIFEGGEYTLFAPNSCAFSNFDPELYQRLITNRKTALDFVKRYLVRSCLYSNGLQDEQRLLTEAGTYLIVQITPDCILISGNKMLYGDVSTTNGVLHVIANILLS